MQQTKTALCNFKDVLSHNGLVLHHGSLPVARARFWLLMASVRPLPVTHRKRLHTHQIAYRFFRPIEKFGCSIFIPGHLVGICAKYCAMLMCASVQERHRYRCRWFRLYQRIFYKGKPEKFAKMCKFP